MAEPKLTRLAQLAAELPSMNDALDDVIARAHQVDSEAAQAWATETAARTGELDALRTQVAALEKQLAAAKPADAKPATPPPVPPVVSKPALPKLPAPPLFDARPDALAPPPARRTPWLAIGGAFAAGLAIAIGVVAITRSDDAPAPAPAAATTAPPPAAPAPAADPADKIIVPPPPSEPAAVASPQPTRKRVPAVLKTSEPPASRDNALIDPFSPHPPAEAIRDPSWHPTPSPPSPARTPRANDDLFSSRRDDPPRKPAKPTEAKPASDAPPRGELIDPFQSQ